MRRMDPITALNAALAVKYQKDVHTLALPAAMRDDAVFFFVLIAWQSGFKRKS